MLRQAHGGVIMEGRRVPAKIRKRGCSSSSSTSSRIRNHRLNKRAILVGKNRAGIVIGIGGSRSSTPVPAWRTTPLRSTADSPKYSQSAKSTRPVSARQLAATLWGMKDMPSPRISESNLEPADHHLTQPRKNKKASKREKTHTGRESHSGYRPLPPHLSDPSHSPTVSEKMDRSGSGSHHRRTLSISQRLKSTELNALVSDSISNMSFMEVERSRPSVFVNGSKNRLKDASNALTTSKELLKIINRVWAHADQPSSSMSLISALHSELERARLQVNQFIQEYRSEKKEINYLVKCFSEEKASWKNKEQQAVDAAIESIASEVEMERKTRYRFESLNKKLVKELEEMKASFLKVVKDLETEKRAREITEQMCDELARNIEGDVEVRKRLSVKGYEQERERDKLEFSERVQMKQISGKSSALNKLRKQLEGFLGTKRDKRENSSKFNGICHSNEPEDGGVVDEPIECKDGSAESEFHSIELNSKWTITQPVGRESIKLPEEIRSRNSLPGHISRVQKGEPDGFQWGIRESSYQNSGDRIDRAKYLLERARLKSSNGVKDHALSTSNSPFYQSPSQQKDPSFSLQDSGATFRERSRAVSSGLRMSDRFGKF